jgi:serine/threonine protein kinase
VYYDKRNIKMVLEYCDGGSLQSYLKVAYCNKLDEKEAAQITVIIANALAHMHEHGVVHRDLKPANILCTKQGCWKVSDFGLSSYLEVPKEEHEMDTQCGTPSYVAPEVLTGDYDYRVDYWSLGVTLHLMLTGHLPFVDQNVPKLLHRIKQGRWSHHHASWHKLSDDAKSCVQGLLCQDREKRLLWKALRTSQWIRGFVDVEQVLENQKEMSQAERQPSEKQPEEEEKEENNK